MCIWCSSFSNPSNIICLEWPVNCDRRLASWMCNHAVHPKPLQDLSWRLSTKETLVRIRLSVFTKVHSLWKQADSYIVVLQQESEKLVSFSVTILLCRTVLLVHSGIQFNSSVCVNVVVRVLRNALSVFFMERNSMDLLVCSGSTVSPQVPSIHAVHICICCRVLLRCVSKCSLNIFVEWILSWGSNLHLSTSLFAQARINLRLWRRRGVSASLRVPSIWVCYVTVYVWHYLFLNCRLSPEPFVWLSVVLFIISSDTWKVVCAICVFSAVCFRL